MFFLWSRWRTLRSTNTARSGCIRLPSVEHDSCQALLSTLNHWYCSCLTVSISLRGSPGRINSYFSFGYPNAWAATYPGIACGNYAVRGKGADVVSFALCLESSTDVTAPAPERFHR
ncbi:hypothetical protein METHP14_260037 [Pseudomonas sp. P14-2025]